MGFLSSADLIECSASDLVGQYVGHTGPKTKKLFEKALGKVLFVDEAYRLGQGHFAQEAMDEIVGLMTNEKFMNKMVIILAGYETQMNSLLSVNPGLASRFSEEIILTNMPASKCLQVLDKELQKTQITLPELADTTSSSYSEMEIIIDRMSRLSNWGNARDVKSIAQRLVHHAFSAVVNNPGSAPSLTADEAISIMKDLLDQQRQRLNIPRINAAPPPSPPPMASSSNPAPPPPPSQSGSSATGASQPPKPPPQKSNKPPRNPPPQSGPSKPSGFQPPNNPPPQGGAPPSKPRGKHSQPPPPNPLFNANTTPQSTPGRRSRQLRGSQQGSPASTSSQSLPPSSISNPSPTPNATPQFNPRRSRQFNGSQQGSPASNSSQNLPPSSISNPSPTPNVTPQFNPRRSKQFNGSQQGSPASNSSYSLPPSSIQGSQSPRPPHSQGNVPPTPNQRGKAKQSTAQNTPPSQPIQDINSVERDPGIADVVWGQLQRDKAAAQEAERISIEETRRRGAELARVSERQRDIQGPGCS